MTPKQLILFSAIFGLVAGLLISCTVAVVIGLSINTALNTASLQLQELQLDCSHEYNQSGFYTKIGEEEFYCSLKKREKPGSVTLPAIP